MGSLKEKLKVTLGFAGIILWYIIALAIFLTPLICLDFPLWADIIILFIILEVPLANTIAELTIWIWSFIEVVSHPINGFSIYYFIAFAIYFLTTFWPFIYLLIIAIISAFTKK